MPSTVRRVPLGRRPGLGSFFACGGVTEPGPGWIDALAAQQLGFDSENALDRLAIADDVPSRLLYGFHPHTLWTSS